MYFWSSRCAFPDRKIFIWIFVCCIFQFCDCDSEDLQIQEKNQHQLEQNLRACCTTQFAYKNGVCEFYAGDGEEGKNGKEKFLELEFPNLFLDKAMNKIGTNSTVLLRLKNGLPDCKTGGSIFSISILESNPNYTAESENKIAMGRFDVAGVLHYNNQSYEPIQYCLNGVENTKIEVVLCNPDCNSKSIGGKTCLRKCCRNGEHLKAGDNSLTCVPSNGKSWKPLLHHNGSHMLTSNETQIEFSYSHPSLGWCRGSAYFMYEKDYPMNMKTKFRVLKDGNVIAKFGSGWEQLESESYCLEGVHPSDNDTIFGDNFQETAVFYCKSEDDEAQEKLVSNISEIYWILAIFSSFFVLITIIVYTLLWETQNIHGWTLLGFFTSLFSLYVFLAAMYVTQLYYVEVHGSFFCWSIGVILHFSYLSTFCWMTVLNFDLWSTFRNLRNSNIKTSKKFKRFAMYSLFAIGIPGTILGITLSLDSASKMDSNDDDSILEALVPKYGVNRCFLTKNNRSGLVFLYGPISVLLSLNLIFFLLTVRAMYQIKKVASIATVNCKGSHSQSVHLFGKLFVVMGVTWIFEVITWCTHSTTIPWWYTGFDVINICHGIFIFVIFVCKRSTIRLLEQKYPSFKKLTDSVSEVTAPVRFKMCCCSQTNSLQRARQGTIETRFQELEERRKSNETDNTTTTSGGGACTP